jgi:lipopolysaccharide/colanic/teichoic acid biosynthesis glycosyltransferase
MRPKLVQTSDMQESFKCLEEERAMTQGRIDGTSNLPEPQLESETARMREVLSKNALERMIAIERKRTERSKEPFLLMLLEAGIPQGSEKEGKALNRMVSALLSSTRETDVIGWYKDRTTVGVIFTGLGMNDKNTILSTILSRVSTTLRDRLTSDQFSQVSISFHFFPDDWDHDKSGRPSNPALYPDLMIHGNSKRTLSGVKRAMDIAGSAFMLILCAPLLLIIAMTVKVTSKGPALFKQQRVGQYGQSFTFLKFRSMYIDNDHSIHKEYVTKLIASKADPEPLHEDGKAVYKLTNDCRITRVGKILRRTSLDELPQLFNVLRGEMSLVGPRPAIPYELAAYQTWHRRRVLEVKPGLTGLWQVTGRSRVKFDDMVRLDLRYATFWSPWVDFKILMRTPLAVIKGAGAV